MKKRVLLITALTILIVFFGIFVMEQDKMLCLKIKEDQFYISLRVNDRTENIYPWYNEKEDLYYVFLPSCVEKDMIYIDKELNHDVEINGIQTDKSFCWIEDEIYHIKTNNRLYRFTFMKSANIPAVFIETESGSMNYLHADKENEEKGAITVVSSDGNLQYNGKLARISGRGNSTWIQVKKPYSITLADKYPLCGLSAGKEWKLLSLYFEHDKIHSKLIFDLGREMGIENTPECTWVDLYCHGEYKGLYLLTEDISAKETLEDKYLIERTLPQQLQVGESSFSTEQCGYLFKFAKPHYPTLEQVKESAEGIQYIETLLLEKDPRYRDYIDTDSIAKQFLLDKIVMDMDGMTMSTFFYLKDGRISAGPLWDYDRAVGTILSDYRAPIEDNPNGMYGWYMVLYENEEFYHTMVQYYIEYLPYFQKILEKDIDDYTEMLSASIKMDSVLMRNLAKPNETVSYLQYDNYVKYLKYFVANRLNYLGSLWQVDGVEFRLPESTGELHRVDFVTEDGTVLETRYVCDGECIEGVPSLNTDEYWGWFFHVGADYRGKMFYDLIPIYEDTILYAKERD